ncbi:MAG: hypothetical protein IJK06_12810 [Clostridia bacterium]|nr:hypothetical protein [Clostridia bacterium]MBR0515117.1 hypothetical protein [Clostridia bacterium]
MKKRRRITCILLCLLTVILCASASAGTCITAVATSVNPDNLACTAVNARILGYHPESNTLTLELIVPEVFSAEEVENLKVGDAIYSQGKEIPVKSIEDDGLSFSINGGGYEYEEGTLWLVQDSTDDRNYRPMNYNDYLWTSLAEIQVPVPDSLLFLDDIDTLGGPLPLPAVYTAEEFLRILREEAEYDGVGFATNNVYVVFDGQGTLASIERYYVPWQ